MRNPDWVRDEVILAMDLYFGAGRRQLPPEHQDVILLSELLNRLPIHPSEGRDENFRNPNGISMILGNFLGVDPEHETPGLSRNNRLQEEVWREFAGSPNDLRQVADAIARACDVLPKISVQSDELMEDDILPEGRLLTRLHLLRERNRALVERKREQTLARTARLSGIFVETLERAAENCGLKVEWTEEVGWGAQIEGLEADRYDIVGSPVWANPTRGKLTTMSIPVYYSGIGIYVRQNDDRFTDDWSKINSPDVRIVTIDGETGDLIARTQFPNAKRVSLPQLTDISQLFLDVSSNKADILFAEPYFAHEYLKSNPGTVKNIAAERPIRALGNCYMFKKGEFQYKQMLDVAIEDLLNSGFVDDLIKKYEPAPNTFYWKQRKGCHARIQVYRNWRRRSYYLRRPMSSVIMGRHDFSQLILFVLPATAGSKLSPQLSGKWCNSPSPRLSNAHVLWSGQNRAFNSNPSSFQALRIWQV